MTLDILRAGSPASIGRPVPAALGGDLHRRHGRGRAHVLDFLEGTGGKGVATGAGTLLVLARWTSLILFFPGRW